jgi:helicase
MVRMLIDDLARLGIPEPFIDYWKRKGMHVLTDIQERAFLNPDIFGGKNILVLGPTSSGKTFIGEVLAVDAARRMNKVLYLVPLKAIAEEKYCEFKGGYEPLGLSVVASSGDHGEYDEDIKAGGFDLAVIVYEKLEQLLVQAPGLLSICGLIVVDEIQTVRDGSRGAKLELLLT